MKVILNNGCDFTVIEMECIPRKGDILYYNNEDYIIRVVEWCLDEKQHVNLMLDFIDLL